MILPAEIEDEISGSIRIFRAEGAPISESMVAGKALFLVQGKSEFEGFKASRD